MSLGRKLRRLAALEDREMMGRLSEAYSIDPDQSVQDGIRRMLLGIAREAERECRGGRPVALRSGKRTQKKAITRGDFQCFTGTAPHRGDATEPTGQGD